MKKEGKRQRAKRVVGLEKLLIIIPVVDNAPRHNMRVQKGAGWSCCCCYCC